MRHSVRHAAAAAATCALVLGVGACSTPQNRGIPSDARPIAGAPPVVSEDELGALPSEPAPPRPLEDSAAAGTPGEVAATPAAPAATTGPDRRTDDVSAAWPKSVDATAEPVVARVGGQDVPLSELVAKWMLRDPMGVRDMLDDIVLTRVIIYEASALEVELPDGMIDASVRGSLKNLEQRAIEAGADDLDTYVRGTIGMDPEVLVKNLQQEAAVDLLAPRCVRAWLLGSDRREIRILTVTDSSGVDQVRARLAKGEAFEDVAQDLSTDPSKERGGRMPPVVRSDDMMSRTAFATEVGETAGPIRFRDQLLFLKVEAQPAKLAGSWADIGAQVTESLEARDIEDPEFWQWKKAMVQRYEADVRPFLSLANQ